MRLPRLISTLLLVLTFSFFASAQESPQDRDSAQRRLYPSQRENRRGHGKQDQKAVIDSLTRVIESLREELRTRDSLETQMVEIIEEEEAQLPQDDYTAEKTDSLLNLWYLQNPVSRGEYEQFDNLEAIGEFNSDSVRFTTNVPDSVLVERLKKMNSFITLPFNPIVKNYMILYSEKNAPKMKRILSLSD